MHIKLLKNTGELIEGITSLVGATKLVDEHDEVIIECIGGKMGRAKGDIPGVRWQVLKVNDQSLKALLGGKLEKARKTLKC